jgi:type IV fimbrial biogenesis protein FimT
MTKRPQPRRRGFTLAELAVVLAVVAVAIGLALPNLHAMVRHQRLRVAAGDLFAAVNLARAQALARGHRVKLMPRDAAGADWGAGWIVFADRDGDGVRGEGDELIHEHGPLAPEIAIGFAFSHSAPPWYIAYNGAGRGCSDTNSAAARWGTLSLSLRGEGGGAGRRITINMLGRARLCDPDRDASCGAPAASPEAEP